jgi:hypothetical protein
MTQTAKNRIRIFGPKPDGTYVVEFRTSKGETLAISVPADESTVLRHFQAHMPRGLFVPDQVSLSATPSKKRETSRTLRIIKDVVAESRRKKSVKRIRVEAPVAILEAARVTVGRYTARRDKPHFQGDQYHAHADIPGGYEVSWNTSGSRRHPNKFPAQIPADAKAAVAQVLGVDPHILEGYTINADADILLIEVKQ